ncbi:uncharacterized protein LOC127121214 [Lathyrus oleraceus]|nr:uncharacterized protein LOC127121214 [Pisum sativum]
MQSTLIEDMEIEKELKLINKVPIKSIHTKFGYIVDCIDINNQPAFNHPLLKNHTLQRHPNFRMTNRIIRRNTTKITSTKAIFGLRKNKCPTGSVPIKRATKDDLIRGKSYFNNGLVDHTHGNHYAEVISYPRYDFYNGVSGTSSVYNVKIRKGQSSSAVMYIRNGPDSTSYIGMGWHIAPDLYNDDDTHFYVVWTADNFKNTGCFNHLCPGFVQTSKKDYLGGNIGATSIYGGHMVEMTYSISQDPETKNWVISNESEMLGYFPASLFPNMAQAHQVGWGGRTSNSQGGPSPQMGSGYFPDKVFTHSSYFKDVAFQVESKGSVFPYIQDVDAVSDRPDCFYARYYGLLEEVGYSLQFGGPGGSCGG